MINTQDDAGVSLSHLWRTLTGGGLVFLSQSEEPHDRLEQRKLPGQVRRAYESGQTMHGSVHDGALWWVVHEAESEASRLSCIAWSSVEGPWGELLTSWTELLSRIAARTQEADELTKALVSSWDRLTLLYELMQIAGETEDLSLMLESVVRLLAQVATARDVFLVLREKETSINVTASGDPLPQPEVLFESAVLTQRPVTLAELHRALREANSPLARMKDLLVAGILTEEGHVGILGLLDPLENNFDANDVQLVASVAEQVSALIQAEKARARRAEQTLLEHELAIAAEIQSSLLPDRLPELAGLELAVMLEPARQVGGDFYDVTRTADGDHLLMLADVSGKGSPAALLTALLHTAFHAEAAHSDDPAVLLSNVNELLYHDLDKAGTFITAFVVKFNLPRQEFVYASAGHVDAAYWQHDRQAVFFLPATGLPLGIEKRGEYRARSAEIAEGNALWVYSDGITEARNERGTLVGGSGLADLVDAVYSAPVQRQIDCLRRYLHIFTGGKAPEDDMAAVIVRAVRREDQACHAIPFVLPATLESIYDFVEQMRLGFPGRSAGNLDLPQSVLDDVSLAFSEVASNQVEHAYADGDGVILGRFEANPMRVEVHLFDQGLPFDPDEVGLPLIDAEDPPERGYGLRLAFGLLDVCEVERLHGRKNHWQLVKKISEKMEP